MTIMNSVDFYLLKEETLEACYRCACRLTYKAWQKKTGVYFYCETEEIAKVLDDMLWTFKDISFIPHQLITDLNTSEEEIVMIGFPSNPALSPQREILINLTSTIPEFFKIYPRILEIVPNDPNLKAKAREKYKIYQRENYITHTHEINQ